MRAAQVGRLQNELRAEEGRTEGLDFQLQKQHQRMNQLLSSLAATADISASVLDDLDASQERDPIFSAAVQQLCTQVPFLLHHACMIQHI